MHRELQTIIVEVEKAVVGKREVIEKILMALLADGHVLLDDIPSVVLPTPPFPDVTTIFLPTIYLRIYGKPCDFAKKSVSRKRNADYVDLCQNHSLLCQKNTQCVFS